MEESLAADEAKVNKQNSAAENILKEGTLYLSKATAARNMQELKMLVLS